jgi:hypothetical protein
MSERRSHARTERVTGPTSEADGDADTDTDSDSESESESESETAVDVDVDDGGDEGDERPSGSAEDTTPPPNEDEGEEGTDDQTVPSVELDLYDLSVRVSGQSTDDLDAVDEAARGLMNYLVDQARRLEDRPDDRGLS